MVSVSRVLAAASAAARWHAGQVRKGSSLPYVTHPLEVAARVAAAGGSEAEVIAAVLHDVVEDCGVPLAEIAARFGSEVAEIVFGCTDVVAMPWRSRKALYVAHLATAPASVRLVAGADKVHNARAILSDLRTHGPESLKRFSGGRDGVLWYYDALAVALAGSPFGAELAAVVAELKKEAA